jgi:hypothetical protein
VRDNYLSQRTQLADGSFTSVVYQDNDMLYDSLNRLIYSTDGRAKVSIAYDLVGIRRTNE